MGKAHRTMYHVTLLVTVDLESETFKTLVDAAAGSTSLICHLCLCVRNRVLQEKPDCR